MGIRKKLNGIEVSSRARVTRSALAIAALCAYLCIPCSYVDHPRNLDHEPEPAIGANALLTRANYGLLTWDNKAFFNNCWRFDFLQRGELASSVIYFDPASSTCGWRWSCPEEAVSELKGYPSLIVGDKVYSPAGFDPSTDSRFPLYLPLMKSLWTFGDIRVAGSGVFDFAYDLAFLEGPLSTPAAVRSEIMIWLKASLECPARKDGDYVIDCHSYDFYVNTDWNPKVPYLAFVLKNEAPPQRLPLHEFIKICIDKGYVDSGGYLAAIELGPEIWWGDGEASVRDYRISLNGD